MPALTVRSVSKAFGGVRALSAVDLELDENEILGLIGPNGSGKTTLVNVVSGFVARDSGSVLLQQRPIADLSAHRIVCAGIARTFQNLRIFRRRTALENVLLGQTPRLSARDFLTASTASSQRHRRDQALELLARFGLQGRAASVAGMLSFGEQKRLELARAMASAPRVLLLDEPAGGMNPSEIEELKARLREVRAQGVAILLIEHNMKLVMELCDRIAVLASGELVTVGTPQAVRQDARVIKSYLGEE